MLTLSAWVMYRIILSIMQPLRSSVRHAEALAGGDLSVSFASSSRDEIGNLQNTLDDMRLRWSALVHELQATAGEVNTASHEIAMGNLDLSKRTESAAAQLQQAAGSFDSLVSALSMAVRQLDILTQQNAALVEQSGAATESLSDQASRRVGSVGRFRLGAGETEDAMWLVPSQRLALS